jgi:signal transduction histidine kinase
VSRRLLASYLALTFVVLVALEVPLAVVNTRNERQDLTAKVERDAFAAASLSEDALQSGTTAPELQKLALRYRHDTGGRLVIVDRRGQSLADSHPTTRGERNFASRPEIKAALRGSVSTGIRPSETLHQNLLYVAVPVASSGAVFGAVRITYPTSTLDHRVARYRLALLAVGLIVLGAAALVGALLSRSFTRPLRRLEAVSARVGSGELAARASERDGPPEIRRLAAELNRTTAKLAALLTSQEQFVADASHELRTPLTALRLRLENEDTAAALVEVERLSRLVDELLALARADGADGTAEQVLLDEVVNQRIELWEPLAAERGVRLVAAGDGGRVRAGRARVEEVLDNLLSNAIDASGDGTTVMVAAHGTELHVIDEGPGLSAEQRLRAFDRFWRASVTPGSGLGLAIARRLVELDGGTIELAEAPSGGIDAVVRYPRASSTGHGVSVRGRSAGLSSGTSS